MNKKHTFKVGKYISMACLLFACATVQSCRDEYYYDDREPEWLGASIYEYLEEKGEFTYFLKVIEDLDYKDVLSTTGSKTLFVANDEAFINGVKKEWKLEGTDEEVYNQLTPAHKRIILYNAMLDNAYLLELMSSTPALNETSEPNIGRCLRQVTSSNVTDTIGFFYNEDLPQNNPIWDRFRQNGIRLALDATSTTMVHFLEEQLYQNSITAEDLNILLNKPAQAPTIKDAFIFDKKVIDKNVTCKNGYVHQLDGLLIPPSNMAEELRTNGKTDIFSGMLDRFAVPVPNASLTAEFNRIYHYGDDANAEQVYEKRYWTKGTNRGAATEADKGFLSYIDTYNNNTEYRAEDNAALFFDPGWNEYRAGVSSATTKENDMGVIFAPTDEALDKYFSPEGEGQALLERFKHRDSIPVEHLQYLMRNMMKNSFNAAVPSRFTSIMDDARDPMGIEKSDIEEVIIANNGVIYITNKVYSPARYVAVTAPVLFSDTLSITNWAMTRKGLEYDKYLLSMGSHFSFVVPSNGCMVYYDPYTANDPEPKAYIFRFNPDATTEAGKVYAEEWTYDPNSYDPTTNSYTLLTQGKNLTTVSRIEDMLKQMYEYYIIVGDFTNGNKYHMAKGYGTVKVETDGEGNVINIMGGAQVQNGSSVPVGHTYPQKNGNTYRLDASMIQPATQSVFKVLSTKPEFSKFYELCDSRETVLDMIAPVDNKGVAIPDSIQRYQIFASLKGLDYNVRTFNTYHYTVYVPTNDKIEEAYAKGLPNWDDMELEAEEIGTLSAKLTDMELEFDDLMGAGATQEELDNAQAAIDELTADIKKRVASLKAEVELVTSFVKYHFQDNSVYVDNLPHSITEGNDVKYVVDYETATLDTRTNRFSTVNVRTHDNTIGVCGDFGEKENDAFESHFNQCHVVTTGVEGQDYNIMTRDIEFAATGNIETSSYAVVHQIDNYLVNDRIFDAETQTFIK